MKRFLSILIFLCMVVASFGCGSKGHDHVDYEDVLLSDMWDSSCHTEKMQAYLKDEPANILKYATGTSELSKPQAYHFTWEVQGVDQAQVKEFKFVLSSDPIQSQVLFETTLTENEIDLYNLYLLKNYFWSVTVITVDEDESFISDVQEFATAAAAPRVLNVPGVTNCRDLGGWHIDDRKYVKQGMIFRTGRMNDNKKDKITITEEGIKVLKDDLGIKTEIDLRQDEIRTTSALGEEVHYINIPMAGSDVYKNLDNLSEGICNVFTILSDENNYPVQIHCSVGADRTGLIAFLVNGVLGVDEEDLYRDYLFSNFGKVDGMRELKEITDSYVAVIKSEEGDSLQKKIENYLLKIGVSSAEIESVRNILTEER